jgi:hypothetical protein
MLKFLAKLGLKSSEKAITQYLKDLEIADSEEIGMAIGRAAILHYSLSLEDPEFSKLLNSQVGENQGAISSYILKLNDGLNHFNRSGAVENAAGIKLLNVTFRCMSNNIFRHFGIELWKILSTHFDSARCYLENYHDTAITLGNEVEINKAKGALGLYNFIPPQYRE